jgi:hypothetical protein
MRRTLELLHGKVKRYKHVRLPSLLNVVCVTTGVAGDWMFVTAGVAGDWMFV